MSEFNWFEKCLVVPLGEQPRTQRQWLFSKYYEDIFKKLGKNRTRIAEIGSGRGTLAQYFARDEKNVTCVDISKKAVDLAKENFQKSGLDGTFIQGDATHLPFGRYHRKHQDLLISVGLIEHLEGGEWQKVFYEAHRSLRAGGVLAMINVPKKFSIQTLFQKNDHYHREALTPEDYVKVCYEAGFSIVKYMYVNPFPLVWTGNDPRKELFWTRIHQFVYWLRSLVMKDPMRGSRRWAQAHLLLAIKP